MVDESGHVLLPWRQHRRAFSVAGTATIHGALHRAVVVWVKYQWRCLDCITTWRRLAASQEWGTCQHKTAVVASEDNVDDDTEPTSEPNAGATDIKPVIGSRPKRVPFALWSDRVRTTQSALVKSWDATLAELRNQRVFQPDVKPCICGASADSADGDRAPGMPAACGPRVFCIPVRVLNDHSRLRAAYQLELMRKHYELAGVDVEDTSCICQHRCVCGAPWSEQLQPDEAVSRTRPARDVGDSMFVLSGDYLRRAFRHSCPHLQASLFVASVRPCITLVW